MEFKHILIIHTIGNLIILSFIMYNVLWLKRIAPFLNRLLPPKQIVSYTAYDSKIIAKNITYKGFFKTYWD